jgi:hypothetical protein
MAVACPSIWPKLFLEQTAAAFVAGESNLSPSPSVGFLTTGASLFAAMSFPILEIDFLHHHSLV